MGDYFTSGKFYPSGTHVHVSRRLYFYSERSSLFRPRYFFVWLIAFDLSGMGNPPGSNATAGIALRVNNNNNNNNNKKVRAHRTYFLMFDVPCPYFRERFISISSRFQMTYNNTFLAISPADLIT